MIRNFLFLSVLFRLSSAVGEMEIYRIQASSPVELKLPVENESVVAKARRADGKWQTLSGGHDGKTLLMKLGQEVIGTGDTMVVLNPPDWIDLEDREPPTLVWLKIDGKKVKATSSLNLGWLELAPAVIEVKFKDDSNPIDQSSIQVSLDGESLPASQLTLKMSNLRRGKLACSTEGQWSDSELSHSINIRIDDHAMDETALERNISFRHVAPFRTPGGTRVKVDSLTSNPRWRKWEVVVDGAVMNSSMNTTVGRTWISDNHETAHWIEFEFSKKLTVGNVKLSWAYWEVFRTSVAYDIQIWSGRRWVTNLKVRNQTERQTSVHTFKPVRTERIRIWQPSLSGHAGRKYLMWLAEVKVGANNEKK